MVGWEWVSSRRCVRTCALHGVRCTVRVTAYDEGVGWPVWLLAYDPAGRVPPSLLPTLTGRIWLPALSVEGALAAATRHVERLGAAFLA